MYQIKTKKEVFAGFMLCLTDTEMLTQLLLKPPLQATMLKKNLLKAKATFYFGYDKNNSHNNTPTSQEGTHKNEMTR